MHGTCHPCPSWGVSQRCYLSTYRWALGGGTLRCCVAGHGCELWGELWAGEAVPGHATLCQVVPSHLVPCPSTTAAAEQPASHPGNAPCTHSTLNVLFGESAVVSRD